MTVVREPWIVRWFALGVRAALPKDFQRQYGQALADAFGDLYLQWEGRPVRRAMLVVRELALLVLVAFEARRETPMRFQPSRPPVVEPGTRGLGRDARHAIRGLRNQPIFALSAIITLALGIGLNTAIFSVVEAVLLNPPPYPHPDQLVYVFETAPSFRHGVASPANYRAWESRTDVFEAIAAIQFTEFYLGGQGPAEQLHGRSVSPAFFRVMALPPFLGRTLVDGDGTSPESIVVISFELWQRRFGGDSTIVGRSIALNGAMHRVIGVMPKGFDFPFGTEIWTPLVMSSEDWARRTWYFLQVIGRLRDDLPLLNAQQAMDVIAEQRQRDFPDTNKDRGVSLERFHDVEVGNVRANLWMLFGSVGFVLLIACANVTNLLLTRSVTRTREISIRTALGASRGQIAQLLMVESIIICLIGGGVGVALASAGVGLFGALAPSWFPRVDEVTVDAPVLAYTLGIALLTSIVVGLAPTRRLTGVEVADSLRADRDGSDVSGLRLRHALVVIETALALVLLIGAGLLLRSFHRLTSQPLGFDRSSLLTAEVSLPRFKYSDATKQREFFAELVDHIREIPSVSSAGGSNNLPFTDYWYGMDLTVERADRPGEPASISAMIHNITSDYFATLGVPLSAGRPITDEDRFGEPLVAVVNDAFVQRHLGDSDPLRATIRSPHSEHPIQIVGVVGNTKHRRMDDRSEPTVYLPLAQHSALTLFVVAHTSANPLAIGPAFERAVRDIDPSVPVVRLSTMDQLIARSLAQPRFYTVLLGIFAGMAATLSGVGIYGLLAYLVVQREREIGIRMALGAQASNVIRLIVARAVTLVLVGGSVGLVAAVGLTRILENLLFDVAPTDPMTFAAVTIGFLALAAVASYGPARRGTKMSPIEMLRAE